MFRNKVAVYSETQMEYINTRKLPGQNAELVNVEAGK
jgi:hypothetical protein